MDTPNWCPLHPGPLVAVPVPHRHDTARHISGASLEIRMLDGAWNNCRDRIIRSARALGQEVDDEKPR